MLITGEKDHIAPHAIAAASYKKQKRNPAATQIQELPDRFYPLLDWASCQLTCPKSRSCSAATCRS